MGYNNLPYDDDCYEGEYKPLDDSTGEYDILDVHMFLRERLQSQLEDQILMETQENAVNLADQVVIIATDSDYVVANTQLNQDNTPYIAYGIFRGLLTYLQTVYECDDGDLEEIIGDFWEGYYTEDAEGQRHE